MNEKRYKKRLNFNKDLISRQSQQIEYLTKQNEKLKERLREKDEILSSIEPIRKEMEENINRYQKLKNDYKKLVDELKQMKKIFNKEAYKNRWWLIKFLIR